MLVSEETLYLQQNLFLRQGFYFCISETSLSSIKFQSLMNTC